MLAVVRLGATKNRRRANSPNAKSPKREIAKFQGKLVSSGQYYNRVTIVATIVIQKT